MLRGLAFLVVLAGCLAPGGEQGGGTLEPGAFAFDAGVDVDEGVIASEPDVVALTDGTLLLCGVGRRGEDVMYLWRQPLGGEWERVPHPDGPGVIDCALGVDDGGAAYYATSAGGTLTVATTRDGAAWDVTVSLGAGDAAFDRPFVAAGARDRALVLAYHARDGLQSWSTDDAGVTWRGPSAAQPRTQVPFQSFSNPSWLGNDSYAFAYAPLEPRGAGLEPHDVWVARTDDAGATWTFEEVAPDRGNLNNVFPSTAARDGRLHVAWAESGDGGAPVEAWLWSGGEPARVADATLLMPRVVATADGPVVVAYAADAGIQPSFEHATWRVEAHRADEHVVVDERVHEGSVATGGYGALASHFAGNPGRLGTQNSQELLHNLGAAVLPDGRVVVAYASDADGPVGIRVAVERGPS